MCECGCVANDVRYKFAGPGKSIYVLSLSRGCIECDAPAGITIEHVKPSDSLYEEYQQGEFIDGPLEFNEWPDSRGVAIVTGMLRHEFVKALSEHLIGVSSSELGTKGRIDKIGAETILEEMFADSQVKPHIVSQVEA